MAILPSSPATNSSGMYGVRNSMFSLPRARSCMIFEARNSSRRWMIFRFFGELGDEDRVLHRRVAAADHGDVLALEEGAVADTAGGDAAAAELQLAGDAEPLGLRPHREDHGLGPVGVLADLDGVDAAVGQLDLGGVVGDEAGAEALGLGAELVHHLRPHDALGVARVVLDVGGVLELAAPLEALDDQGLELGAGGVERRRVAGGPAADDDQVFDLCSFISLVLGAISVLPERYLWSSVCWAPYFTFYSSARGSVRYDPAG